MTRALLLAFIVSTSVAALLLAPGAALAGKPRTVAKSKPAAARAAPAKTETVFSLDGMGLYFVTSLLTNDPYPVMAWLMVTAVMIIIFNLIADVLYGYLDPRVRYD